MKSKLGVCFLAAVSILMLAILVNSSSFRYLPAKLLPMVVAGIVLVLAIIELVRELRGRVSRVALEAAGPELKAKGLLPQYLREAGWLVGFCAAIYLLGFLIAMPVFIILYLKSHGRRWLTTIVMAGLVPIILYGIFTYAVGVSLYPGLVSGLLEW